MNAHTEQKQPGLDPSTLAWIDTRVKDARAEFEQRLSNERGFVVSTLSLAAKICGIALFLVFGVFGFFGYKDIAAIDDKITKAVNEKIKEKSDEFSKIYEKNIQGLTDQALITAYNIQFSAPPKRFERQTILPSHLQRFVHLLEDQNSDTKILESLYELLSNSSRDEQSSLVDNKLTELVGGSGRFTWIKSDTDRLSKVIDLMTSRSNTKNPSLVRAYLIDETTAPAVRRSAVNYAEAARDTAALPTITKMLDAGGALPNEEVMFAAVSLDSSHNWVLSSMARVEVLIESPDRIDEYRDFLNLAIRVANRLVVASEKRRRPGRDATRAQSIDFAARILGLVIRGGGKLSIGRDRISEEKDGRYALTVEWPKTGGRYLFKSDIILAMNGAIVTKLARDFFAKSGPAGLLSVVSATVPDRDDFDVVRYIIRATFGTDSKFTADIGGVVETTGDVAARLIASRSDPKGGLRISWKPEDAAVTKTGKLVSISNPSDVTFSVVIDRYQDEDD